MLKLGCDPGYRALALVCYKRVDDKMIVLDLCCHDFGCLPDSPQFDKRFANFLRRKFLQYQSLSQNQNISQLIIEKQVRLNGQARRVVRKLECFCDQLRRGNIPGINITVQNIVIVKATIKYPCFRSDMRALIKRGRKGYIPRKKASRQAAYDRLPDVAKKQWDRLGQKKTFDMADACMQSLCHEIKFKA